YRWPRLAGGQASVSLFRAAYRVRATQRDSNADYRGFGIPRRAAHFAARIQNARRVGHADWRATGAQDKEGRSMKGGLVSAVPQLDVTHPSYLCPNCGVPRDYEHFDESGFADTPAPGGEVVLARFELQPQYCGLLENFSQFTNHLGHLGQVETPGLQWIITRSEERRVGKGLSS